MVVAEGLPCQAGCASPVVHGIYGALRVWARSQGHPLDTMLEVERNFETSWVAGCQRVGEWDRLALPNLQSGKQLPSTSGLGRAGTWDRAKQESFLQAAWRGSAGQSAKQPSKQGRAPQGEKQARAPSSQSQH